MNWIYSVGGPLVCASPVAAKKWGGIVHSSVAQTESDYDRACNISDYIGSVPCGTFHVLVLGDEPLQSTFVVKSEEVMVVRWVYCVSEVQAIEAMCGIPDELPVLEEPFRFCLSDRGLVMFDAALDGVDSTGCASVDVMPGIFTIITQKYKMEGVYEFIIHRLRREDESLNVVFADGTTRCEVMHVTAGGGLLASKKQLHRVLLENITYPNSNFSESDLRGAFISKSNQMGSDFSGSNLAAAFLNHAKLDCSSFVGALLRYADFSMTHLVKTNFTQADLYGCNLSGTNLCGAIMLGMNLEQADFHDAVYDVQTVWPDGFNPAEFGLRFIET
ncbi:MAG: hypothetical protein RLY71_535 [Pseudomonadota bacterium]|jgi:uncharacterized protein YjbI with pentapeptide repeats